LAVNELAINAAKHAYARGESGDVNVEAERDETSLRVSVADHGAGLGAGFDPEGARGLGMGIVQAIVRQLGGRLLVEDHEGARFTLIVPLDGPARERRTVASPEG
jgi:two-component sensor histidine kinase